MRILFVVHGMGVHGQDWAGETQAKLNEVAARYGLFNGGNLTDQLKFVPITYDGEFTRVLKDWTKSAEELDTFAKEKAVKIPAIVSWLKDASEEEKNFFWSHVVDVVLYRFFQIITAQVRLAVMEQITRTLSAEMRDGTPVQASVLAHSLGTSVTHDALSFLATTPFGGSEAFMVGKFRFENIFMIANVGRILETTQLCYESCLHPASVNPDTAYTTRYYNFRHARDPIPVIKAFKPVGWGEDFRTPDADLDHLHDFNVHGFEHYLDHPEVHIRIINGLFGRIVSKDKEKEAIQKYPRISPNLKCIPQLVAAEERFKQLVDLIKNSDDVVQLVIAASQFFAAAKEARNACR